MDTTLSHQALIEARTIFTDWVLEYDKKLAAGTPLTLLEQYEYTRLNNKLDGIERDLAAAQENLTKRPFWKKLFRK